MTARAALVALVVAAAAAAAFAPTSGATNECRGITACIRVVGPWVVVPPNQTVHYLLACPRGRGVVGGLVFMLAGGLLSGVWFRRIV